MIYYASEVYIAYIQPEPKGVGLIHRRLQGRAWTGNARPKILTGNENLINDITFSQ